MHVSKKIVTDESMRPIAVQIPYQEWLEIERRLKIGPSEEKSINLAEHEGLLVLAEDPIAFQERIRGEWA